MPTSANFNSKLSFSGTAACSVCVCVCVRACGVQKVSKLPARVVFLGATYMTHRQSVS